MFQRDEAMAAAPSVLERVGATVWRIQGYGLVLVTFLSFFPSWFHREEYLFFALLLIALATAWWEGRPIWTRTPIGLPLLLFVSWVLLTIPFATDPAYSFAEWRKLVTQVLVFYWALLVLRVQSDKTVRQAILAAIVLGTVALSAYALFDFVERGGTWKDRYVRAFAPSSDYNWLSTYLVIAIPLLAVVLLGFRGWWQRLLSGSILALALMAQIFAYTRAAWLALVAQGVTFGLVCGRRGLAVWVLIGCLIIGVGLIIVSQQGYHTDTVDPWTLDTRLQAWEAGILEMLRHPLVGIGYGNYAFSTVVHGTPIGDTVMGLHSTFLMVGVGSGIPALAILVWLLVGIAKSSFQKFTKCKDEFEKLLAIALILMVVGFSVRNLFDYMFAGSLAYLFWILVATSFIESRKVKMSYSVNLQVRKFV